MQMLWCFHNIMNDYDKQSEPLKDKNGKQISVEISDENWEAYLNMIKEQKHGS